MASRRQLKQVCIRNAALTSHAALRDTSQSLPGCSSARVCGLPQNCSVLRLLRVCMVRAGIPGRRLRPQHAARGASWDCAPPQAAWTWHAELLVRRERCAHSTREPSPGEPRAGSSLAASVRSPQISEVQIATPCWQLHHGLPDGHSALGPAILQDRRPCGNWWVPWRHSQKAAHHRAHAFSYGGLLISAAALLAAPCQCMPTEERSCVRRVILDHFFTAAGMPGDSPACWALQLLALKPHGCTDEAS